LKFNSRKTTGCWSFKKSIAVVFWVDINSVNFGMPLNIAQFLCDRYSARLQGGPTK